MLGAKIGAVVDRKNAEYGDAHIRVAAILLELYPDGVKPSEYQDLLLICRLLDKMCRISNGHKLDSYEDITGYGLLGTRIHEGEADET